MILDKMFTPAPSSAQKSRPRFCGHRGKRKLRINQSTLHSPIDILIEVRRLQYRTESDLESRPTESPFDELAALIYEAVAGEEEKLQQGLLTDYPSSISIRQIFPTSKPRLITPRKLSGKIETGGYPQQRGGTATAGGATLHAPAPVGGSGRYAVAAARQAAPQDARRSA
jgi:hypothetical protein